MPPTMVLVPWVLKVCTRHTCVCVCVCLCVCVFVCLFAYHLHVRMREEKFMLLCTHNAIRMYTQQCLVVVGLGEHQVLPHANIQQVVVLLSATALFANICMHLFACSFCCVLTYLPPSLPPSLPLPPSPPSLPPSPSLLPPPTYVRRLARSLPISPEGR